MKDLYLILAGVVFCILVAGISGCGGGGGNVVAKVVEPLTFESEVQYESLGVVGSITLELDNNSNINRVVKVFSDVSGNKANIRIIDLESGKENNIGITASYAIPEPFDSVLVLVQNGDSSEWVALNGDPRYGVNQLIPANSTLKLKFCVGKG